LYISFFCSSAQRRVLCSGTWIELGGQWASLLRQVTVNSLALQKQIKLQPLHCYRYRGITKCIGYIATITEAKEIVQDTKLQLLTINISAALVTLLLQFHICSFLIVVIKTLISHRYEKKDCPFFSPAAEFFDKNSRKFFKIVDNTGADFFAGYSLHFTSNKV
jgi:hypothetical protein